MTLNEIKAAIDNGRDVRWKNDAYHVYRDTFYPSGEYLITFEPNGHTIGLTHRDGVTLNGEPGDFYIKG